jgi:hypothetical protein
MAVSESAADTKMEQYREQIGEVGLQGPVTLFALPTAMEARDDSHRHEEDGLYK